jgi:hypothetical protein
VTITGSKQPYVKLASLFFELLATKLQAIQAFSYLEPIFYDVPELLGLLISWVIDLDSSTLGDNLFGGKRSLGVSPPGVSPPFLYFCYLSLVALLLSINRRHVDQES